MLLKIKNTEHVIGTYITAECSNALQYEAFPLEFMALEAPTLGRIFLMIKNNNYIPHHRQTKKDICGRKMYKLTYLKFFWPLYQFLC